mmetsp:Transcript_19937/g.24588  ORF Transcript_19937/g.24588 Transcript_19937/m.24588 type:complete len:207 (+) Transcript_19937:136-756(+)
MSLHQNLISNQENQNDNHHQQQDDEDGHGNQTQTSTKNQLPSEKAGAGILLRTLSKKSLSSSSSSSQFTQDNTSTSKTAETSSKPKEGDTVKIHYEAYLCNNTTNSNSNSSDSTTNNNMVPFDSSRKRNAPFCFVLGKNQVIEGLNIAVEQMELNQVVEVIIPYLYGYGQEGYPPIVPPKSTLKFHVELLDFTSGDVYSQHRQWKD